MQHLKISLILKRQSLGPEEYFLSTLSLEKGHKYQRENCGENEDWTYLQQGKEVTQPDTKMSLNKKRNSLIFWKGQKGNALLESHSIWNHSNEQY